jgi:hypothetical protein
MKALCCCDILSFVLDCCVIASQVQSSLVRIQDAKSAAIWFAQICGVYQIYIAHSVSGFASSTASCSSLRKTLPNLSPYSGTYRLAPL